MRHQVPVFGGLLAVAGVLTLLLAPSSGSGQQDSKSEKSEELQRSRMEDLEARVSKLEKQLAANERIGDDKILLGDMVGNLLDDRMSRYWRVKIVLKSEPNEMKAFAEAVNQKRPEMKNWVLKFMADETVQSFSGGKNQARLREEFRKAFGEMVSPGGKKNLINEVLFEVSMVQ